MICEWELYGMEPTILDSKPKWSYTRKPPMYGRSGRLISIWKRKGWNRSGAHLVRTTDWMTRVKISIIVIYQPPKKWKWYETKWGRKRWLVSCLYVSNLMTEEFFIFCITLGDPSDIPTSFNFKGDTIFYRENSN
jgi:hypothetical protein